MRYAITLLLIAVASLSRAQDVAYRLAGASSRTWVGQSAYVNSGSDNPVNFTFSKDHTVVAYNPKYKQQLPAEHWMLIKGDYYDDDYVIVQIGKRQYHVEFSKTTNGRDYMVMTTPMLGSEDQVIANTYFAE